MRFLSSKEEGIKTLKDVYRQGIKNRIETI